LLPPNKLKIVNLSNVPKLTDTGVFKLAEKVRMGQQNKRKKAKKGTHSIPSTFVLTLCSPQFIHLERVDLSQNEKLTVESAEHMLRHCKHLKHLNLSSIFKEPPTSPSLTDVIELNPHHMFMSVKMNDKDCIFEVERSTKFHIMTQLEQARYNFCLIHGAKVVQAGWRRLVKYRRETVATRNTNRHRHATATMIQSHARRRIAAAFVEKVRHAKVSSDWADGSKISGVLP
jgi:hypothetical protein